MIPLRSSSGKLSGDMGFDAKEKGFGVMKMLGPAVFSVE